MSTKLFPMDSVYHISRVSGLSQLHYFVLMSKCFSSPKCRKEGHRFPRNGSSVPHCCREKGVMRTQTLTRRGGKVKSITLTISICSTKTANEGVWEGYLRNKSTHTGPLDPSSQSSITTRNQNIPLSSLADKAAKLGNDTTECNHWSDQQSTECCGHGVQDTSWERLWWKGENGPPGEVRHLRAESFLRQSSYGKQHRANFRELLSCCGHLRVQNWTSRRGSSRKGGPAS